MSSNTFEEVERVCDRVIYISEGKVVSDIDINDVKKQDLRIFKAKFADNEYFSHEKKSSYFFKANEENKEIFYIVKRSDINKLIKKLSDLNITNMSEYNFSLKEYLDFKLEQRNGEKEE